MIHGNQLSVSEIMLAYKYLQVPCKNLAFK